ncbi:MAG TPA: ABC transporter substrate-binding protein [Bradyrhizobium sp.]|nr:ABC transporter substrate-binding protein [Bradyrhizobium sp.]
MVLAGALSMMEASAAADLTIGVALEPGSLDPHLIWTPGNTQLSVQIFGTLTRMDADGRVQPGLAKSWDVVDGRHWRFRLDPLAKFSNGTPVTATDVVASLERARDLPNGTFRGIFANIEKLEAEDAHTVLVRAKEPQPTIPAYFSVLAILPADRIAHARSQDFADPAFSLSSGPYQLKQFVPGDRIVMTRNPYYAGPKPEWDNVTMRFLTDSAARIAALLSGQIDVADGLTPEDAQELRRRGGFNVVSRPSARTVYMTFDLSRDVTPQVTALDGSPLASNPFKDIRVRQAMTMAVNRQGIINSILLGQGVPMNQISAPALQGYNRDMPALTYDPEKAKALLAEAGYPKGFALTVTCMSGRLVDDAQICQALGQMLARIGLKTTVDVQPYSILVTKATCHCDRRPSFFMSTWSSAVVGETSMALTSVLHSYNKATAEGLWNLGDYVNPEVDRLIDEATPIMDNAERFRRQAEIMKLAMKDLPVLPLHIQNSAMAARKGLMPTIFVNETTMADGVHPE